MRSWGTLFLILFGGSPLLALAAWFRRGRPTPDSGEVPSEAEDEEEWRQSVAAAQARRQQNTPPPQEGTPPAQEPLTWEELEDVYTPTLIDTPTFLANFGMKPPTDLLPGQSCILLRRAAYASVWEHLQSNLTVEQGGLLIGQAYRDPNGPHWVLLIEVALAAPHGVETPTQFGYTPETWQVLTPQLQNLEAQQTILGSYHSHPNLGVFLSHTDLDTQADVFAQEWQMALVIDPVASEVGFFMGRRGEPCPHWYLV